MIDTLYPLKHCFPPVKDENIARIANAVPVTLYSRVTVNVQIVVLNCQKCNQCLKGHKSEIVLWGCFCNCHCLCLFHCIIELSGDS